MKLRVRDVDLFFDVHGPQVVPAGPRMHERPVAILLHTGPGLDHSSYKDHLGPALDEVAQVVYLDVRGAGRSDRSTRDRWNLETWAADLGSFCDELGIERPVFVGTAFGAYVALSTAACHPDLPAKLVLVSAVARYSHTRSIAVFDRLGGARAGEIAARYFADPSESTFAEFLRVCVPLYTRTPMPPDVLARMEMNPELSWHWDAGEGRKFDLREEAGAIRCPTLVLAGEDDPSTTASGARELVASLPSELVRYQAFADAGHGVFRDAPEAAGIVKRFVSEAAALEQ